MRGDVREGQRLAVMERVGKGDGVKPNVTPFVPTLAIYVFL